MSKSYEQAIADNVETYIEGSFNTRNRRVYIVYCGECNTKIKKAQYQSGKIYICDRCKRLLKRKQEQFEKLLRLETKEEERFNKAVHEIEKQTNQDYSRAISVARTKDYCYGSVPEAMVAIELLHLGYKIIPQQKILSYKVDFAVPSEKKILEIDGTLYHKDRLEAERDLKIRLALGTDWKVVHIPAEYIKKNIKMVKKIMTT